MPAERGTVREVGPRDGFQNEPERIETADKIRLINALAHTGLKRLEVASFVRPDVIPQLSDSIDVMVVSPNCQIPSGANAAALTITVAKAAAPGFVTAWPTGSSQPTTSSVNYGTEDTVANSQLLQLGTGGRISLYTA